MDWLVDLTFPGDSPGCDIPRIVRQESRVPSLLEGASAYSVRQECGIISLLFRESCVVVVLDGLSETPLSWQTSGSEDCMVMYLNPLCKWGWRSISLVEFGFLWSVFFAFWGPVPRYFGWLIAIIGLLAEFIRKKKAVSSLDRKVQILLLFILVWGFFPSFFRLPDLYSFIKGYSLVLEFAFSLWIAARLYSEEMIKRFWSVFLLTAVISSIYSLFLFFSKNHFAGIYSNILSLGLHGVVILPFVLSRAFSNGTNCFFWILSAGVFVLIAISSSSGAWTTSVFCLFFLCVLGGKSYLKKILLLLFLFIALFGGMVGILEKTNPALKKQLVTYMTREYSQLTSFHDFGKFTTNRAFIWKGSLNLIKKYPISGWGWGAFSEPFAQVNKSWWNEKQTGMKVDRIYDSHNMYLNLATYAGIPSLVAVVLIFIFAAYKSFLYSRMCFENRWFWIAVCVSVPSILIFGFGGDIFSIRYKFACVFWYLLGFACKAAGNETTQEICSETET